MHDYKMISVELSDNVAKIVLNRPDQLNAFNLTMAEEMLQAADWIANRPEIRALLITGSGRGFCSGADLKAGSGGSREISQDRDLGEVLATHFNPLFEQLHSFPIPVVTAVNGPAAGAGCSLALIGDVVLAGESAYFLQAFVHIGLVPDCGSTWLLPRLIGRSRASAMMLLGERISARRALEWGMIWDVVDDALLLEQAEALAQKLARGPTIAMRLIRSGLNATTQSSFGETLQMERVNQRVAGATEDFAEGLAAFNEKRTPRFAGR